MKKLRRIIIKIASKLFPFKIAVRLSQFFLLSQGIGFAVEVQDSGAIMVGGSGGIREPLVWSGGSSYGTRIDVQGWFEGIVTTSTSELADLYFPAGDSRQSYTQYFGGTSGASPQIVSVIASFNSAVIEQGVEPWSPLELRALLRQTGRSQPFMDRETLIGSQPDASTLLRMWAW